MIQHSGMSESSVYLKKEEIPTKFVGFPLFFITSDECIMYFISQ